MIYNFILSIGTIAEGAPVVPISAQLKYNIEVICEFICKKIPVPVRDFTSSAKLIGLFYFKTNSNFDNPAFNWNMYWFNSLASVV